MSHQGLRGYVSARGFGPYNIPVPIQSLALREYCARKKLLYVLPANENCFPHSYLILEGLIRDLSDYEGIVMCSMHMLPQRPERRRRICESVLAQGCSLHLTVEDFVIASAGDLARLEELLVIDRLAGHGPKLAALDSP